MELKPLPPGALNALPVFPLPGIVLFPGIVLPLHVFERRYKALVSDALNGNECLGIVMTQSRPGAPTPPQTGGAAPSDDPPNGQDPPKHGRVARDDASAASAALHGVACAGRIIHADRLDEGRYNVLVHGMERVALQEELEPKDGYRRFSCKALPRPTPNDLHEARDQLAQLQSCVVSLRGSVAQTDKQLVEVLRSTPDPLALADILSAVLISDVSLQQELLASTDLRLRLATVVDCLAEAMVSLGDPPDSGLIN